MRRLAPLLAFLIALVSSNGFSPPAGAHPPVWIDMRTGLSGARASAQA